MFLIREAQARDLKHIRQLAKLLDTVNLPHDSKLLGHVLSRSRRAFGGRDHPLRREYLFVAEDLRRKRVVGTSMIIAQHGTREAPHLFFEVRTDERYSGTLRKHFRHQVLRLGADYDGPTEIGGLILLPDLRGAPEQLGKQLSFVRFLFMGIHPERFRPRVLSELLPPLEPDGTSILWEHFGRKFTELSYTEADRISRENKEFIRSLFPSSDVYAALFPVRVQRVIGRVGKQTQGVAKMLSRIGFRYSNRIDPFDGGPHYEADIRDIPLVKNTRRYRLRIGSPSPRGLLGLVAVEARTGVRFRCVRTEYTTADGEITIPREAASALGARTGRLAWATSFPLQRRTAQSPRWA